ncbi:MAG: DNA internalization-related competence protein ComEC/Rec2 [Ruminococcaceae bacterium]|nr:DNA internalization-related competence protein ComEC/Rec2 [Oscillospiraceae bacterium]
MRKLMLVAIGYTAALIISIFLFPEINGYILSIVSFILVFISFFFKNNIRKILAIILVSASIGFLWNSTYDSIFIKPAEQLIGNNCKLEARVLDYPSVNDNYSSVLIKITDKVYPSCKVLVTDYENGVSELKPGDIIDIELKFRSARIRYNTEDDYYFSSGIFLRATASGNCELIGHRKAGILDIPKNLSNNLKEHIMKLFPEDVAPLMKALLTGDKAELYDNDLLYVSLKKAGMSHIIAVSGMHVSFIISLIALIWGRRRMTAFIGIPLVWFFAAMMGFTPSVTRASLMITLLLISPILRRENDSPTSLSAALLVLLIINPKSIGNLSLQLSFASMAGIILITPRIYSAISEHISDNKFLFKLLNGITMVFASSVGALVFTTPIAALNFGYIPLYSIFANILCLWAMSLAFTLAYPICIVGAIYFPLAKVLAIIISILPKYTQAVVTFIGHLPYSLIYTSNNLMAMWLAFVYSVIIISYLFKGDRAYRPILPVCCCIVSLIAVCFITGLSAESNPAVSAIDVGQGQCIVAKTTNSTVMIDCGGKGSPENAGDCAAEFLLSSGREKVDLLILTHMHDDHANGVVRLMSYIDVNKIAISDDIKNSEIGDKIIKACYDSSTELIYISENTSFFTDGLTLNIFAPIGSDDSNENGLIVLGDYGEFEFLVTGDAGIGTENQLVSMYQFDDIELLVVGHHGSKYSTGDMLLDTTTPDYAFISVGINSYGHPTEEVLQRLYKNGIEVYRTDINGNLTLMVGN